MDYEINDKSKIYDSLMNLIKFDNESNNFNYITHILNERDKKIEHKFIFDFLNK